MAGTDYARTFQCAEEMANSIIDTILTSGGITLWQKYLERKAFLFARDTAADALVAHLEMCFVAHDLGEELMDEIWDLEGEPVPQEIDSWARLHLPVKKRSVGNDECAEVFAAGKRIKRLQSRLGKFGGPKKSDSTKMLRSDNRMCALPEDMQLDEDEERLRSDKAQEKTKQLEGERLARQQEKELKAHANKIQVLHEEMERRAHTFDTEGGLIWIDEPKVERLPKVQESFSYNVSVKKDALKGEASGSPSPAAAKKEKRRDRKGKLRVDEPEYMDFFDKLLDGQPPIHETIVVRPGVALESGPHHQVGPDIDAASIQRRQMSRKEYVLLAERESAGDPSGSGIVAGGKASPPNNDSPQGCSASGATFECAVDDGNVGSFGGATGCDAAAQIASTGILPPLGCGRGIPLGAAVNASAASRSTGGTNRVDVAARGAIGDVGSKKGQIHTAPAAPHPMLRGKYSSLGYVSIPPRYHQPVLGGPFMSTGSAQPPIGATMGHGLIPNGGGKDAFFFPSQAPEPPSSLLRAASECILRRNHGEHISIPKTRSQTSLKLSSHQKIIDEGGVIVGEGKSLLYRNVIAVLGNGQC